MPHRFVHAGGGLPLIICLLRLSGCVHDTVGSPVRSIAPPNPPVGQPPRPRTTHGTHVGPSAPITTRPSSLTRYFWPIDQRVASPHPKAGRPYSRRHYARNRRRQPDLSWRKPSFTVSIPVCVASITARKCDF